MATQAQAQGTGTAVAARPTGTVAGKRPQATIESLLTGDMFAQKLKSLLPTYLPAKTFVQIVCTQLRKVPKLAKVDPASFFARLQECAEMGLAPNGRHAYLVPFENRKMGTVECQLLIGYKGLSMLAKRYGGVTNIYCELWCEGDTLTNDTGEIHHVINYTARRDETTMLGVVCVVFFKDGTRQGLVMQRWEIESIRNRAQSYRQAKQYGKDCPWTTDFGEMAKKTAFRRLTKWIDISPEFDLAVERDDADFINAEFTDVPAKSAVKQIMQKPKPKELPNNAPAEAAQPQPEPVMAEVVDGGEEEPAEQESVF